MPMFFEFEEMEDAEAFVSEVQAQFGEEGRLYDDPDEGSFVVIDRVWANDDAEVTAIKQRFGLTDLEVHRKRKHYADLEILNPTACAVGSLAEGKIEQLASEFGGEFVAT